MPRIALLPKYGTLAASTRQRFSQYEPYLRELGMDMASYPLLDDRYLEGVFNHGKYSKAHVISRYVERARKILSFKNFDLIWLHYELFPYLPGIFERMTKIPRMPIVFDFDDAVHHNYDLHSSRLVRRLLANRIPTTISCASMVFCGNRYLQDYASRYSDNTHIIPTVVDTKHYRPRTSCEQRGAASIGWIGSPSTWQRYMAPATGLLTDVAMQQNARLLVVGGGGAVKPHPVIDPVEWSLPSEVANIQAMDIGIMPLDDSPWSRGKCGYKLIQYMACGLPVVASPVGVNTEIVEHGVNGFLATTEAEWRGALGTLLNDPALRRRMGEAGRRKAEREYSIQVYGPKVAGMLRRLVEESR